MHHKAFTVNGPVTEQNMKMEEKNKQSKHRLREHVIKGETTQKLKYEN